MKALSVVALCIVTTLVSAQQPVDSAIGGTVIGAGTRAPIANAVVELHATGESIPLTTTRTDDNGAFLFPGLQTGSYQLSATRPGFVRKEFAAAIAVSNGQPVHKVAIELTAGSVISGRISDRGQPVGNASVVAQKVTYSEGHQVLTDVLSAVTNDLGEYEIFWLPPGRYYIAALVGVPATQVYINPAGNNVAYNQQISTRNVLNRKSRDEETEGYAVNYFPGTPDWRRAVAVEVKTRGDVTGINIDSAPLPIRYIRGKVTGAAVAANGQLSRTSLRLINSNTGSVITAQTDGMGAFDIPVIVPGAYILSASGGAAPPVLLTNPAVPGTVFIGSGPASVPGNGRVAVDISDRDQVGIVINLSTGLKLASKFVLEGQSTAGLLNALSLVVQEDPWLPGVEYSGQPSPVLPQGARAISGTVAGTATFSLNIQPGDYRAAVAPIQIRGNAVPQNLASDMQSIYVKSIQLGERDVLHDGLHLQERISDEPLVIIVRTGATTVRGRVVNDHKETVAGAAVVIIPDDNSRFRTDDKFTFSDLNGRFQLNGIAPGTYRIFTWENVDKGAWQDPDFIQRYIPMGTPVEVKESVPLTVGDVSVLSDTI
jgi:hypothetical protein